jgi:diacylglycerol kinase (ATP)
MTTTTAEDGAWQAAQLIGWGADAIIILGGDGTIRATAPILAEAGLPVLLVPTGTANVLSRHIGIASTRHAIEHCLQVLSSGLAAVRPSVLSIPINDVEVLRADGSRQNAVFLSLAGIGGDARAIAHHHLAPGLLGYAMGAARSLFADVFAVNDDRAAAGAEALTAEPTSNPTHTFTEGIWSVMASKVARPAGPISVFPDARIDADTFSVLTVGPLPSGAKNRMRAWAGIAAACLQGRPDEDPHMHYRSTTSLSPRLATPAPAQLDGDLIGDCLELHLSTGTTRLLVSAPAS